MSREAFEKLPEISKILKRSVQWSEKFKIYHVKVSGDFEALRDVSCVAGAWSVWQKQQKRIDELERKVTDLSKNLKDRESAVLVRQEKIDAALQELMGAIRFTAEDIGNDPDYIKGAVLRGYARLQKKLKGGDE